MSLSWSQIEIDGGRLTTWDAFHDTFAQALGFPSFYGRNGNAWIDCMTSLDSPEDQLTQVHVSAGSVLTLQIANAARLKATNREIWERLNEMTAFVNWRRIEVGEAPVLALSYQS